MNQSQVSNTGHILFVDGSTDDVEIARWQLARAGLEIRVTRIETADALRAALTAEAPIDLLVAELVVAGFSWQEVLQMAGALRPTLPCILYSGYPDAVQCQNALRGGGKGCVTKDDHAAFIDLVKVALAGETPSDAAPAPCCGVRS